MRKVYARLAIIADMPGIAGIKVSFTGHWRV